jgi:hypothetical protein
VVSSLGLSALFVRDGFRRRLGSISAATMLALGLREWELVWLRSLSEQCSRRHGFGCARRDDWCLEYLAEPLLRDCPPLRRLALSARSWAPWRRVGLRFGWLGPQLVCLSAAQDRSFSEQFLPVSVGIFRRLFGRQCFECFVEVGPPLPEGFLYLSLRQLVFPESSVQVFHEL